MPKRRRGSQRLSGYEYGQIAQAFHLPPQKRRELRERTGRTLRSIARQVGVNQGTLSNWETGKVVSPDERHATARYADLVLGWQRKDEAPRREKEAEEDWRRGMNEIDRGFGIPPRFDNAPSDPFEEQSDLIDAWLTGND